MAITLRTVTGSALSHNQLDTNFSSYFYSASISASVVSLHYTGSVAIGLLPRSSSVAIPNSSKWSDVTGGGIARNSEVQITGSTNLSGSTSIVGGLTQGFAGGQVYNFSHAEGYFTIASGSHSHAEGYQTVTTGSYSHTEGRETITKALGSHAEGYQTVASGSYSHAEGNTSIAIGVGSHAEGNSTLTTGDYSHAEGSNNRALGQYSHAEGQYTTASADYAHAEGDQTHAKGVGSHAEGRFSIASGSYSHAEGNACDADGVYSHAEGFNALARGGYSHAEGNGTQAGGIYSHAEGVSSQATGEGSHAEGQSTEARATGSHAEGLGTIASGNYQHVQGQYNVTSTAQSAFIVGNGTSDGLRSNLIFASGSQVQVSGSLNMSGSVIINNGYDLTVHGNKQFNHGMFYHTASQTVGNGVSASALLSTTSVANGVSITSGSIITVDNPGYYNIQFSAQLAQGANTANFYIWFKKNGTNIANSTSKKTLTNNTNQIMTVDIIDYASNVGDYYEIVHQSDAANSTLEYIAASGNYPAAPSLIVTVQQVR